MSSSIYGLPVCGINTFVCFVFFSHVCYSHVSFVDCPGHDILMATMLNGAAVMDAALLLIGTFAIPSSSLPAVGSFHTDQCSATTVLDCTCIWLWSFSEDTPANKYVGWAVLIICAYYTGTVACFNLIPLYGHSLEADAVLNNTISYAQVLLDHVGKYL